MPCNNCRFSVLSLPPRLLGSIWWISHSSPTLMTCWHIGQIPSCFFHSVFSLFDQNRFMSCRFRFSKYSSHFGSNGLASALTLVCRRIGLSECSSNSRSSFSPSFTPNIQSLVPPFLPIVWKYLSLIHCLLLDGCLFLAHFQRCFHTLKSTLRKVSLQTCPVW